MALLQKAISAISPLSAESRSVFLNGWKHWSAPKDYFLAREHSVYFKWQSKSLSFKLSRAGVFDRL